MLARTDIKIATLTLAAVEAAVVAGTDDGMRLHLGASQIGKPCARAIWYSFRWALKPAHEARMLRLFARGQREEEVVVALLRNAGIEVCTADVNTGKQFSFSTGHFGGSLDGVVLGLPDSPKTWHLLEVKTANAKSFKDMADKGVLKAKPEHYDQMQAYMAWSGLTRALYVMVCKDDDQMHMERINFDRAHADRMFAKAQHIIDAKESPEGISTNPSWYLCKWCEFNSLCYSETMPQRNCRTCAYVTPDVNAKWFCERYNHTLPVPEQKEGCADHLYIPALFHFARPVDSGDGWVMYERKDNDETFVDGKKRKI